MQPRNHIQLVREWCQSLGVLSAVSIPPGEAEMKLAAYVPLLAREFRDGAFNADSLAFVARRAAKGFPTYGELCGWLGEWWRDHKPLPPALAAPAVEAKVEPPAEPTAEERDYVHRRVQECLAALRASAIDAAPAAPTPRYLTPAQLDVVNPLPNGRKRVAEPSQPEKESPHAAP